MQKVSAAVAGTGDGREMARIGDRGVVDFGDTGEAVLPVLRLAGEA